LFGADAGPVRIFGSRRGVTLSQDFEPFGNRFADTAMYRAKKRGGGSAFFDRAEKESASA
jgi:hypothetical protein